MTDPTLEERLEELADEWVAEVVPQIYDGLEKAGISYSDELVCHLLADGFKAGYWSHKLESEKGL